MKLNKVVLASVVLSMLFFISCGGDDDNTPVELKFEVSTESVADFSATLRVGYNGDDKQKYYVFTVEGSVADVENAIADYLSEVHDKNLEPYTDRVKVLDVEGLKSQTTYTSIVFGVNNIGGLKGISSSVEFTTKPCQTHFAENPEWTVNYFGQAKWDGKTYSKFDVDAGSKDNTFIVCICSEEHVKKFEHTEDLLANLYVEFMNTDFRHQGEFGWTDAGKIWKNRAEYYKYLTPGNYQAFVIGVDDDNKMTGSYANSEVVRFAGYELEQKYSAMLGKWKLIDCAGYVFTFVMEERWANCSFSLSNWGNNQCPVIMNCKFGEEYELTLPGQVTYGVALGEKEPMELMLTAWTAPYYDSENLSYYHNMLITTLAKGKLDENGNYVFERGYKLSNDDQFTGLAILYYNKYNERRTNAKIRFPFTIYSME